MQLGLRTSKLCHAIATQRAKTADIKLLEQASVVHASGEPADTSMNQL